MAHIIYRASTENILFDSEINIQINNNKLLNCIMYTVRNEIECFIHMKFNFQDNISCLEMEDITLPIVAQYENTIVFNVKQYIGKFMKYEASGYKSAYNGIPIYNFIPVKDEVINRIYDDISDNKYATIEYTLFRQAFLCTDVVAQYMFFYNILLQFYKDSQSDVDRFILDNARTEVSTSVSPRDPKKNETVFTRLRNEVGHKRGVAFDSTRNEISANIKELIYYVELAINNKVVASY